MSVPKPSVVIDEYLAAGELRWGFGEMRPRVNVDEQKTVECHCGVMILYDRLAAAGIGGDDFDSLHIEMAVAAGYDLSLGSVTNAEGINDNLDPDDDRRWRDLFINEEPMFAFLQEIAPKQLRKVADYYRSIGK